MATLRTHSVPPQKLKRVHNMIFVADRYAASACDHVGACRGHLEQGPEAGWPVNAASKIDDFDLGLCEKASENETVGVIDFASRDTFTRLP